MATQIITPAVTLENPKDNNEQYEAEMLAKADAGLGAKAEEKLLAGKYKTTDDLNKGILELISKQAGGDLESYYKGLEKSFHGKSPDKPADSVGEVKVGVNETIPVDEAVVPDAVPATVQGVADNAGLDFDKYNSEFTANGSLSEDSVAEIEKSGIPKAILDQYVAGLQATQELARSHAFGLVGGEANYTEMVKWAKVNLKPEEIAKFNGDLATTDLDKRGGAIASLYTRFTESNPILLDGEAQGESDVYASRAEMSRDMNDPRYKKDPAFRQAVMEKLSRSKIMK